MPMAVVAQVENGGQCFPGALCPGVKFSFVGQSLQRHKRLVPSNKVTIDNMKIIIFKTALLFVILACMVNHCHLCSI